MRSGCFLLRFGGRQASQHAVEDGSVRAQVVEPGRAVGLRGDGDRCEAARQVAAASNGFQDRGVQVENLLLEAVERGRVCISVDPVA